MSEPRRCEFGISTHPPRGETADHADRRRCFDADCDDLLHRQARATCTLESLTQRRREFISKPHHPARSWPSDGQGPLGGCTTPKARFRRDTPPSGLRSRRAQASPPPLFKNSGGPMFSHHKKVRARRNRHAFGVSAGGATMRDERSRSERMVASPVAGDREIAGDSAGHSRRCRSSSAMNPSCLCVFVFATRVGGLPSASICVICGLLAMGVRPALRLCAFASLRFFLSVFLLCVSVSLWLSSFRWAGDHSEFRIPNSEFS